MFLKIGFAQKAAIGLHEIIDLVRDLASVKSVPAFLADYSQCFRKRWILEDVAFCGCAAFAVERVRFQKRARQTFIKVCRARFWKRTRSTAKAAHPQKATSSRIQRLRKHCE